MPELDLKELRDFLLTNLGLNYTVSQEKDLYRKITDAAKGFEFAETDDFITWLVAQKLNDREVEKLASYLTIGETYFLRESQAFDYLEYDYLPQLIQQRRKINHKVLKIWSAGCASGEEPYTIAVLLCRMLPDIKDWDITIMATDINPCFIQKAKEGVYSKWSFRSISKNFIEQNFDQISSAKFKIKPWIQEMVTFSFLNLIDDSFPSKANNTLGVDVIFCRNVMIYFSAEGITKVCNKFYDSLVSTGVFFVSPVEASSVNRTKFNMLRFKGYNVFNKEKKILANDVEALLAEKKKPTDTGFLAGNKEVAKRLEQVKKEMAVYSEKIKAKEREERKEREEKEEREEREKREKSDEAYASDYSRALSLYQSDRLAEAEQVIQDVLDNVDEIKNESIESLYLLLARIKANQGDLKTAEELCEKIIGVNKINGDAYYFLSVVFNEQGRSKEAIRMVENALFLNPSLVLGHYLLGNIKMKSATGWQKHFNNAKRILLKQEQDEVLDEVDGITVIRLMDILNSSGM